MDKKDIINHWIRASEDDVEISHTLFNSGKYSYSLFFIHLAIEKLLKGLIVSNTKNFVPYEHRLVYLVKISGVLCDEKQLDLLSEITTFNIKGRYDDYKNKFYKTATKEYAEKYLKEAEQIILWLKENFPKM